ncbi:histidine kinase [Flavobacterium faecale]|uniref:Oxygen sensor histidine kinase NreB n=1 Tax=Flavobacterium faecale TaxID=1355330 RepID=A0A2S1LDY7_9FLAO|nr:ATP-binding protein [Flavobacterium faecale]AWG21891.1 histidine kinase [Flavobacterium faecale]
MKKSISETAKNFNFKKLKQRYIFALVTIAITVLLSQLVVQYNINTQLDDSRLINISGRQRMLSQKLVKEILILNTFTNPVKTAEQIQTIDSTISLWTTTQNALQFGDKKLNFPKEHSPKLTELYQNISPNLQQIIQTSEQIVQNRKSGGSPVLNQPLIKRVLYNQELFLKKMNQIVGQYETEAFQKVTLQRNIEYAILAFTLLVLLLELQFIFKPTNKNIEELITKLLTSEKKALKLAYNTEILSESKENSVKELKSLNYAMENTLLYCRVANDGTIIHIGEKFAKLINYTAFHADKKFPEVLTSVEKEQHFLSRIITEKQKSGWQGEIHLTNKDNESTWLDLSMIPVTIRKQESELLVICFDITVRKNAEQEVERLNAENIAEKINQQKIISSKIIENQENEQNRIAREIHDGIGQMLTGLKFSLESINLDDKEKSAQKIEYLKKLSLDIIKGVRTATFNLMPPELSDHGIVSSITKLTVELSKLTGKNILFYNKSDFNQRLDSLIEINLYRLTQEAINNAIKYADSSHIIVQLSHSNSLLSITIDDNGKGFDLATVDQKKTSESGMGLLFMKERIQYINGRVFFNSILGEGTRITFNIPI